MPISPIALFMQKYGEPYLWAHRILVIAMLISFRMPGLLRLCTALR